MCSVYSLCVQVSLAPGNCPEEAGFQSVQCYEGNESGTETAAMAGHLGGGGSWPSLRLSQGLPGERATSQAKVHRQGLVGKALEGVCVAPGVRGVVGLGRFLKRCLAFILRAGWEHLGI